MAGEVNPILGGPLFNFASGISLLLFYAFAMQCMSTLAIVKRETNSWKWPNYQLSNYEWFCVYCSFNCFSSFKINEYNYSKHTSFFCTSFCPAFLSEKVYLVTKKSV